MPEEPDRGRDLRRAAVPEREVGYAGMKDAVGITRQTISIQRITPEKALAQELDGVKPIRAVSGLKGFKPSEQPILAREKLFSEAGVDLYQAHGEDGIVFIKFIDDAGNISQTYWAPMDTAPEEPYFEVFLPTLRR